MGMPTIPEEPFRPDKEQVVIDLLKSIAMEETSIAHLLNAEAEKLQALVKTSTCDDTSDQMIYKFGNHIIKLLDVIVMKEWLLLRKLENAMAFHHDSECCDEHEE